MFIHSFTQHPFMEPPPHVSGSKEAVENKTDVAVGQQGHPGLRSLRGPGVYVVESLVGLGLAQGQKLPSEHPHAALGNGSDPFAGGAGTLLATLGFLYSLVL